VLNNLAYGLAEYQHAAKEALPLAEKAYRSSPNPIFGDTLGWIQHLLGDDKAAAALLEQAVAGAPTNLDILVHSATVHIALGDLVKARKEFDAALKADPKAADRADVKALAQKLKNP